MERGSNIDESVDDVRDARDLATKKEVVGAVGTKNRRPSPTDWASSSTAFSAGESTEANYAEKSDLLDKLQQMARGKFHHRPPPLVARSRPGTPGPPGHYVELRACVVRRT